MIPVDVIGLGLSPDDLSPRLAAILNKARVLAGGSRHLDYFPDLAVRRLVLGRNLGDWLDQVARAAAEEPVAVLASGDPGFFGIAARLSEKLGRENVRVHPNVTAFQAAFARLGLPWQDAALVSLHGRDASALFPVVSFQDLIAVYTDNHHTPAWIAAQLLDRGQAGWRINVLENLGQPDERSGEYPLDQAASREFSPLNVTVLTRVSRPEPLTLGAPDEAFEHEAGLITKSEVRSVALGLLALRPEYTLWDLGAGCGSVSLEACLLLTRGRVAAVEQKAERAQQIRANRQRFGLAHLEVVQAKLPDGLDQLPDPDRIFIGGGGEALEEIISKGAARLKPGGVMVVSLVRLAGLDTARRALPAAGLDPAETMVQISRGAPLGGDQYMKALNPVWLVTGTKK